MLTEIGDGTFKSKLKGQSVQKILFLVDFLKSDDKLCI
jgi:hypothetical protein